MFENDVSPGCNIVVSIYKNELLKEQREKEKKKSRVFYIKCKPFCQKNITLCFVAHLLNLPKYILEN